MSLRFRCPECRAVNKVDEDSRGRKVRCEECGERIRVPEADDRDDDADDRPRRRKRQASAGSGSSLMLLLIGGGVLVLFLLCGGGAIVGFIFFKAAAVDVNKAAVAQNANRPRRGPNQQFNAIARGKVIFDQAGNLAANDPPDPTPELREVNARMKVHLIQMQPGKTYVITLDSDDFDAYLRVESPAGKGLIEDDDSGGNLNSRIDFRPDAPGAYRVIATSFDGDLGRFRLRVQEAD